MKVVVSEIFQSIQGEGPKAGAPSLFIRLGGCNLRCEFCDTKYASFAEFASEWKEYEVEDLVREVLRLKGGTWNLVITGGEPLLQQKALRGLIGKLESSFTSIEVETNGTIIPSELFHLRTINYNVSIKLESSGVPKDLRVFDDAIEVFASYERSNFKFVVDKEEDIKEILEIVSRFYISPQRVFLMPKAESLEELKENALKVAMWALKCGFNYADRLQFRLFKGERGR